MGKKEDGERLATLETQVENTNQKLTTLENSVQGLHGKFDALSTMITTNYVAKDTFEEYKKNRWLERSLIILVTSIISGLVGLFLRANSI